MGLPWTPLDRVDTPEGPLLLQRRGERDFLITIDGRVLMSSMSSRSEAALGTLGARGLGALAQPRVLVGGLGMGYTLRALLDALPAGAKVTVAELNPTVVTWCRGPLADLTARAVDDPRVTVVVGDFADVLREAAAARAAARCHRHRPLRGPRRRHPGE
jgi:spermidine synthase